MLLMNAKTLRIKALAKQQPSTSIEEVKNFISKAEKEMLKIVDIKSFGKDEDIKSKAKDYKSSADKVVNKIHSLPTVNYNLVEKRTQVRNEILKFEWYLNNISGSRLVKVLAEYVNAVNNWITLEMQIRNI